MHTNSCPFLLPYICTLYHSLSFQPGTALCSKVSFFSDVSIFRQVDFEGSVSIWVWLGLRYDESIGVKYVCRNVETLEHRDVRT